MNTCNIIQHGTDGFGHQLHGLFSVMILHGIKNYYFDGHTFIIKYFKFEHLCDEEIMRSYMIEAVKSFIDDQKQTPKDYVTNVHSHELTNIPSVYNSRIIYSLDNAYYFDRLTEFDEEDKRKHSENIKNFSKYFRNNKILPQCRLDPNNIVVHVRLGDSVGREGNDVFRQQLNKVIDKLLIQHPDHKVYIHSDGDPSMFLNKINNCVFFDNKTPLIQVVSDLIHSKILVSGVSSLSTVSTFIGEHEHIIVPDVVKHGIPDKSVRMSKFLNNQTVILLSVGGVGTRLFTIFLEKHNINVHAFHDLRLDGRPLKLDKDTCIIHLHGDPVDSVLSFYGKEHKQVNSFIQEHCLHLGIPCADTDFQTFLSKSKDQFNFVPHNKIFQTILNNVINPNNQVLTIHYDNLWTHTREVCDFLNIKYIPTIFPSKKPRSIKHWVKEEDHKKLDEIYFSIKEELKDIPRFKII